MNTGIFDIIFKSGYNKGIKKNKEEIFEFAKWLANTMYYYNTGIKAWIELDSDLEITDDEIYNLFLENKKNL